MAGQERGEGRPIPQQEITPEQRALNSAFIKASFRGETEKALEYLDNGADIHAMNDLGLRWAIYEGNINTVKTLLDRGANVHEMNDWALRVAAPGFAANTEMAEVLKKAAQKPRDPL
jgi:ankyrin repeat protein